MNIKDDESVYLLSHMYDLFANGSDHSIMCRYWVKANKLAYLSQVVSDEQSLFNVAPDDVKYVIASDTVLEGFVNEFDNFLKNKLYCSDVSEHALEMDCGTEAYCNELIIALKELSSVKLKKWVDFFEKLCSAVAKVICKVARLNAIVRTHIKKNGKRPFHFLTNAEAQDFLSLEINFDYNNGGGKYFILEKQN